MQLADNAKPGTENGVEGGGGWGSVDVFVSNRVKWPHEFVLSGQNKARTAFCRTIREVSNVHLRENMLDYVINLLEDAQVFSWSSAKACHAVLLCRMEQGEVKNWNEMEKIDKIWRAHAQRHATTFHGTSQNLDKETAAKTTPCVYFNKGSCAQKQSHESKGVFLL